MNFFQSLLQRVNGFHQREQEKRDAEDAELARVMAENAEYIGGINTLSLNEALAPLNTADQKDWMNGPSDVLRELYSPSVPARKLPSPNKKAWDEMYGRNSNASREG